MISVNPQGPVVVSDNKRRSKRSRVLKGAKIIFGISGVTVNCLVLDETEGGLRVETDVVTPIPENVTIQYQGGALVHARRRWARGTEIGLEFVGAMALVDEATHRAAAALATYRDQGFYQAAQQLRDASFFGDPEMRRVTEDVEAALARFERALKRHGESKP